MTNRTWTAAVVIAVLLLSSCGNDGNDAFVTDTVPVAEAGTPEQEVRLALDQFRASIRDKDIDAVLESYSERHSSDEAVGMDGLRSMWGRISDSGFAADLELNVDTAQIDINENVASVYFFDNSGEISCPNIDTPCDTPQPYVSLLLENEEERGWLIIGTPPDRRE